MYIESSIKWSFECRSLRVHWVIHQVIFPMQVTTCTLSHPSSDLSHAGNYMYIESSIKWSFPCRSLHVHWVIQPSAPQRQSPAVQQALQPHGRQLPELLVQHVRPGRGSAQCVHHPCGSQPDPSHLVAVRGSARRLAHRCLQRAEHRAVPGVCLVMGMGGFGCCLCQCGQCGAVAVGVWPWLFNDEKGRVG